MKWICLAIAFLSFQPIYAQPGSQNFTRSHGAIIRGDSTQKNIALVFTGDSFGEGGHFIDSVLNESQIHASFFLTGNFLSNPKFLDLVKQLVAHGHYIGSHSDAHLLYCDWTKRDSLLVSREEFSTDLKKSYQRLQLYGISKRDAHYFLPPYEWYNDSIAAWTEALGLQLINYTPGTISHADYTDTTNKNYRSSKQILNSILQYESTRGVNGFVLLMHIGAGPKRMDKFYLYLPELMAQLKMKGYDFVRVDELLE